MGSNLLFVCVTLCYLLRCCFVQGKGLSGFGGCCDLKDLCMCVATAAFEHQELCADHWGPEIFISFFFLSGFNI